MFKTPEKQNISNKYNTQEIDRERRPRLLKY